MQHGEYIFCPSEKHLPHIVNNPFFFVFRFRTAFSLLTCGTFQRIDKTSCCFGLYKAEINSKLNGLFRFSDLGLLYVVMHNVSPTKVMKNRTIFFYNMLCNIIGAFFDVPRGPVDNHQHMSGIRPPTKSHFCLMLSGWGVCSSLLPSSLDPLLDMSVLCSNPPIDSHSPWDLFFVPLWPISSQQPAHPLEMNVANCLLTRCIFIFTDMTGGGFWM